jgi:hypothetical protein
MGYFDISSGVTVKNPFATPTISEYSYELSG